MQDNARIPRCHSLLASSLVNLLSCALPSFCTANVLNAASGLDLLRPLRTGQQVDQQHSSIGAHKDAHKCTRLSRAENCTELDLSLAGPAATCFRIRR